MTDHEPLCPANSLRPDLKGTLMPDAVCQCRLIRKVHTQMSEDGWVAPEAHEAVVAVAKVRAARGAMADLHNAVSAMPRVGFVGRTVEVNAVLELINTFLETGRWSSDD